MLRELVCAGPRAQIPLLAAAAVALLSGEAKAIDLAYPATGTCEWPSSVSIRWLPEDGHPKGLDPDDGWGGCSGVYVGNSIVLTAGHCVSDMQDVFVGFGEDADNPSFWDTNPTCEPHPDGSWEEYGGVGGGIHYTGVDLAYCKLSAIGAPEPPYVPVIIPTGCEAQYLRDQLFGVPVAPYGEPLDLIGSGCEDPDCLEYGTKRQGGGKLLFETHWALAGGLVINGLHPNQENGMTASRSGRGGDSGAPMVYPMLNGTWRTIGLFTTTAQLGYNLDGEQVMRMHMLFNSTPRYLPWIESASNNDITPCHSWDGSKWQFSGGAMCGSEFDTSPEASSSQWPNCESGTLTQSTECSGFLPPGPDTLTSPTTSDSLLEFLLTGGGAPPSGTPFGGILLLPQWTGTTRDDSLIDNSRVSSEVFGGRGNDTLFVGVGADEMHGGAGDDLLYGGPGDDILVPGFGFDFAYGQDGDDTFLLTGGCEIQPGEVIDGGAGYDIVHSPVNAATLAQLGVTLSSIEEIVVNHPRAESSLCGPQIEPIFPHRTP